MLLYNSLKSIAKAKGGAKALIYRDTYLSWRGLVHRVDRRAAEFKALGVRPGDLVALMLGNVPDFIILALSLSKLEAAALPLDPTTSTRELEMLMSLIPLRGLVTRPRGGDAQLPTAAGGGLAKHNPESRRRLQGTLLSCSIYRQDPPKVARRKEQRVVAVLVTADSAGDPKPVERTVGNFTAETTNLCQTLQITDDDRALLTVPLFHAFGFDAAFAALTAGATMYLEDELGPNKVIKLVREQKVTILPGTLTLFGHLARLPSTRPLGRGAVKMLSLGGGLTGSTLETFAGKYGTRPLSCYHSAETGTVAIDLTGRNGNTVGKPLAGVEVRTTHPKSGKSVAAGRKGLLWVRSPAASPLLYGPKSQANGSVPVGSRDRENWYRTGDVGSLDRHGRITLQGREDDLVPIEGKRVALGEVEGCIENFPTVTAAQAAVITDPLSGPMVVARVVLKQRTTVSPELIIDHCARNLAPYKVPRRIEICDALK